VLDSGKPDYPFCLAWANESWSRTWLGKEQHILIKQTYSEPDDKVHSEWLVQAFGDRRYITVHGRPLFLIYRPTHLPEPRRTTDIIRATCIKAGIPEPFLLGVNAHSRKTDSRKLGFDGTVNFEPALGRLPGAFFDWPSLIRFYRNISRGIFSSTLKIYDYRDARQRMNRKKLHYPFYPSIFVGWDNTPRKGRSGVIIINNDPEHFGGGIVTMVENAQAKQYEDRLIFINAWNEWAEGNHLEPDKRYGLKYLDRIKSSILS